MTRKGVYKAGLPSGMTARGVLTRIYHAMRGRCREKGRPLPDFTLQEFHERFLNDPLYLKLYRGWIWSAFDKYKKPSFDRIDPLKSYTLGNLELVTWRENRDRADKTALITSSTQVIMCDKDGREIKMFNSVREAAVAARCQESGIVACCRGRYTQSGGYKWKYGPKTRLKRMRRGPQAQNVTRKGGTYE